MISCLAYGTPKDYFSEEAGIQKTKENMVNNHEDTITLNNK